MELSPTPLGAVAGTKSDAEVLTASGCYTNACDMTSDYWKGNNVHSNSDALTDEVMAD